MSRWKPGPGGVFLIAVVLLGALGATTLSLTGNGSRTGYDYGDFHAAEDRAIFAKSVVMRPGDRLVVHPNLMGSGYPTLSEYDFYAVPGGERFDLLDGNATSTVYAQVQNMTTQSCCPNDWVVFDRPADDAWRREGRELAPAGPSSPTRERYLAALDQPERVDLVWVFRYGQGVEVPENAAQRRAFESRLELALRPIGSFSGYHSTPTVYQEHVVVLQPYLYGAMVLASLVGAGAAAAWAVRLRRSEAATQVSRGGGTEPLLRLYHVAGTYILSLRDLLLASLVVVLLVAFHVAIQAESHSTLFLAERAGLAEGWRDAFALTLALLYVSVISAWLLTLWHVQRALIRWRRRSADAGAILDEDSTRS